MKPEFLLGISVIFLGLGVVFPLALVGGVLFCGLFFYSSYFLPKRTDDIKEQEIERRLSNLERRNLIGR